MTRFKIKIIKYLYLFTFNFFLNYSINKIMHYGIDEYNIDIVI